MSIMKCCRNERKFNLCTLIPKTKEDRDCFWVFRRDDTIFMFTLGFIFGIPTWLNALLVFIMKKDEKSLSEFGMRSLIFGLYCLIYFIGRHYKNCMIYCLPVFFTISQWMKASYARYDISIQENEDNVMTYLVHLSVLSGELLFFVCFYSPNIFYMIYYVIVGTSSWIILEED